jgi:RimJ/RimL family protein N-acetyltransferase
MRIVLRFAFEKMNLHRVWLNVVQREYRFLDGRYHDSVLMAILEDEYREAVKSW